MSEVRVVCPKCRGTFYYPSETTVTKLKCPECGSLLTAASIGEALRRRKKHRDHQPLELTFSGETRRRPAQEEPPMAPPMNTILERRSNTQVDPPRRKPHVIGQCWLILTAGLMLAYQHQSADFPHVLPVYVMIRNGLLLSVIGWIAMDAFRSGFWHGVAGLVFPPYLLLYAIGQVESLTLRGLVFGLLIGLTGEAWLMPSSSLVMDIGPMVSAFVDHVNAWIESAARQA